MPFLRLFSSSNKSTSGDSLVVRVYTDSAAWYSEHHCIGLTITIECQDSVKMSKSKSSTSNMSEHQQALRRLIVKHIEEVMNTTPDGVSICDEISAEVDSLMTAKSTRLLGLGAPVEKGLSLPDMPGMADWAKDKVCVLLDDIGTLIGTQEGD